MQSPARPLPAAPGGRHEALCAQATRPIVPALAALQPAHRAAEPRRLRPPRLLLPAKATALQLGFGLLFTQGQRPGIAGGQRRLVEVGAPALTGLELDG